MKRLILCAVPAFLLLVASCKKDPEAPKDIFKGPEVAMGNGKAWAWIRVGEDKHPKEIGTSFTHAAFQNLPTGGNGHQHDGAFLLRLPAEKELTPFNHVMINWNPNGHPPEAVYGKPHFDFHFYMESPEYVSAIPSYAQAPEDFDNLPPAGSLHPQYIPTEGGEPAMGKHWVDITSPELQPENPAPFTETFIFGTFKGKVLFYEPMITKQFIENTPVYERVIKLGSTFAKDGYYPTRMRIIKTDTTYDVIMDKFEFHKKS